MTIFPLLSVLILATINKPTVTQITGDNKLTLLGEGEGEGRGGEGEGEGRGGGGGGEGARSGRGVGRGRGTMEDEGSMLPSKTMYMITGTEVHCLLL